MPTEKLVNGSWAHPTRLPLGSGWSGHCTAPGHEGKIPDQNAQEKSCNFGYASRCEWLPAQRSWDAVRFAVIAQGIAARAPGTSNRIVHLRYVCEHDHRPIEHGTLSYESGAGWTVKHSDARVQKMAECFLESAITKNISIIANDEDN